MKPRDFWIAQWGLDSDCVADRAKADGLYFAFGRRVAILSGKLKLLWPTRAGMGELPAWLTAKEWEDLTKRLVAMRGEFHTLADAVIRLKHRYLVSAVREALRGMGVTPKGGDGLENFIRP